MDIIFLTTTDQSHLTHPGGNPAELDMPADELKKLCQEYLTRLQVLKEAS